MISETASKRRYRLTYVPRKGARSQLVVPSGFADRLSVRSPRGTTAKVSAPSRTGARTVTIAGPVRRNALWTVTITPR